MTKREISRLSLAALLLLVVLFASVALYYNFAYAGESAKVAELQQVVERTHAPNKTPGSISLSPVRIQPSQPGFCVYVREWQAKLAFLF